MKTKTKTKAGAVIVAATILATPALAGSWMTACAINGDGFTLCSGK